jgi:hypothetical protein
MHEHRKKKRERERERERETMSHEEIIKILEQDH